MLCMVHGYSIAQVTEGKQTIGAPDTMMIFKSPHPLLSDTTKKSLYTKFWSIELLFSGNGFGAGLSYTRTINNTLSWNALLGISGARNTDELEYIDPYTGSTFVYDKINRLYSLPLTIGLQKRVFSESLSESFRPFVGAGIGYSMIIQTPYGQSYIDSVGKSLVHGRPAGYVSIGSSFGEEGRTMLSIHGRYYIIPFGGSGLESVKDLPIKDFGGFFIALGISFGG